jgi:hypothetical protein
MIPDMVVLPDSFNYIGIFLTFRCPYKCPYCINNFQETCVNEYREIPGDDWVGFFRRLQTRDIPITLQGGEPGMHPDFISIVTQTLETHQVDILTNLAFDLDAFIRAVDPDRINRDAPYAPIRVSYHPSQYSLQTISRRVLKLMNAGFRVGLYAVLHPEQLDLIDHAQTYCETEGIDFRTKPFLGWHNGRLYGDYAFLEACAGGPPKHCECAPSELLAAPDGAIHRCHYFCYNRKPPLCRISDPAINLTDNFLPCDHFGLCNPCDVKVKNNRFQQFGHVTARIRNVT